MWFSEIVGNKMAKLALLLNVIDPEIGGVLFIGKRGTGKSSVARTMKYMFPELPFVDAPLNITEESLIGGIDLEETLKSGKRIFQPGVLSRAHQGIIYLDEANLLDPEILHIILNVREMGGFRVEREGLGINITSKFFPIATMNPEEGELKSHFLDRFGLSVNFQNPEKKLRLRVLKRILRDRKKTSRDKNLKHRALYAKKIKHNIEVTLQLRDKIAELCLRYQVRSHRAEITLLKAARAYAAFLGEKELKPSHILKVTPLVFAHRIPPYMNSEFQEKPRDEKKDNQKSLPPRDQKQGNEHRKRKHNIDQGSHSPEGKDTDISVSLIKKEPREKEEVFSIGEVFKVKRLNFFKDRKERSSLGKRTKTRYGRKGGRYVKSILKKKKNDIAIDATIRASAPWQIIRGRKENLIIRDEDIRYRERERKMKHLVIFVVDGSGSMGANRRMEATKGAIQSLLMDCYEKRDKVSVVVFRKDRAEIALPPTSSVELASRMLKGLPVGGKTPLSSALLTVYRLINQVKMKDPDTRVIVMLITDGHANQSCSQLGIWEEIEKLGKILREIKEIDYIVIDTEDKSGFLKTDFALKIASFLGARYFPIPELRAHHLSHLVLTNQQKN